LRSNLEFGAFLVYPPRPEDPYGHAIRNFILGLKEDRVLRGVSSSQHVAARMAQREDAAELRDFLAGAVLVPAPKSAPLTESGALWASFRIATALHERAIGASVAPIVLRTSAVRPSHLAEGPERPWPDQHRASLRVERDLPIGFNGRIAIVDDVVTRGSTLLGCAIAVGESYPEASVVGFAVARTLKREEAMPSDAVQPVIGRIDWRFGSITRSP